jgi:hypothetical protein
LDHLRGFYIKKAQESSLENQLFLSNENLALFWGIPIHLHT